MSKRALRNWLHHRVQGHISAKHHVLIASTARGMEVEYVGRSCRGAVSSELTSPLLRRIRDGVVTLFKAQAGVI
jgi:hypothetical protein